MFVFHPFFPPLLVSTNYYYSVILSLSVITLDYYLYIYYYYYYDVCNNHDIKLLFAIFSITNVPTVLFLLSTFYPVDCDFELIARRYERRIYIFLPFTLVKPTTEILSNKLLIVSSELDDHILLLRLLWTPINSFRVNKAASFYNCLIKNAKSLGDIFARRLFLGRYRNCKIRFSNSTKLLLDVVILYYVRGAAIAVTDISNVTHISKRRLPVNGCLLPSLIRLLRRLLSLVVFESTNASCSSLSRLSLLSLGGFCQCQQLLSTSTYYYSVASLLLSTIRCLCTTSVAARRRYSCIFGIIRLN